MLWETLLGDNDHRHGGSEGLIITTMPMRGLDAPTRIPNLRSQIQSRKFHSDQGI